MQAFDLTYLLHSCTDYIYTRSYYRKESAALGLTTKALGIDYTNKLRLLPYTHCMMNLFCLIKKSKLQHAIIIIYCKEYFGFSYLYMWLLYQCFKPSLVKTCRRTQSEEQTYVFNVIWLVCCKFSYSFKVMIVYCIFHLINKC